MTATQATSLTVPTLVILFVAPSVVAVPLVAAGRRSTAATLMLVISYLVYMRQHSGTW